MNRRDWLKTGFFAGAAGMIGGLSGCAPAVAGQRLPPGSLTLNGLNPVTRRVRNVIFLVYDGTGYEDASAAGIFSRRLLSRPLLFDQFLTEGAAGSMRTHSLTSIVTDSSAASTAWATGRKILNSAASIYPDGTPLTTILELAKGRGMGTGLVTTTRITHATPAAWVAKVQSRDLEQEIALQYLNMGPDVLLGGAQGPFEAASREDGRDLFGEFRDRGYEILRTADDLARSTGSRLLGTFTPGMDHMPFEVDRRFQGHPAPSLADLTRKALEVLSGSDRGFVLQVEAGRIDLANHYNDPGGMIWDWIAADEALGAVKDFVDRDGETLLIFAPDHETGGSVVYGFGPWYQRSTQAFGTLEQRRSSHEWVFGNVLPRQPSASEVRDAVAGYLGLAVTEAQAEDIVTALTARPLPLAARRGHFNAHGTQPDNTLGQILSTSPDRQPDRPNIAYATGQHTAGLVPVVLYGGMVPRGNLGVIDNTELFGVMTKSLGIDFENPSMTEEQALELAAAPVAAPTSVHA